MKARYITFAILACCAVFAAVGCKPKTAGSSVVTSNTVARDVKLSIDGAASVQSNHDAITLTIPGHKMVIEKERLLLDGVERAKVPAAARKFEFIGNADTLAVTADGAEIFRTPLAK